MAGAVPEQMNCVGLRVIRGEKWTADKEGGGAGYTGTIINSLPDRRRFWIQWDNGDKSVIEYPGQKHLTVLDVTQIGNAIKHIKSTYTYYYAGIPLNYAISYILIVHTNSKFTNNYI